MIGSSNTGLAKRAAFFTGDRTGDLEGHLRGVDVVVGTVGEAYAHVDNRVTGQHARGQRLGNALVDRLDVLLGDDAARDLIDELVSPPGPVGSRVMTTWPY